MASISTDRSGRRRILFVDNAGNRQTIYLGKCSKRNAEAVKLHLEHLLEAATTGNSLPRQTANWVAEVQQRGQKLASDLAKFELIEIEEPRRKLTLGEFIEEYIAEFQPTVKPNTLITWKQCQRLLLEKFDAKMLLTDFTTGHGIQFRNYLLTRGNSRIGKRVNLAETTVRKRCSCAKQFFAHAVALDLISKNPFEAKKIPTNSFKASQKETVSIEQAEKIIGNLPNAEWRLLFALARYAGLRIPSEPQRLRWCDIRWDSARMIIHSPKTEHHEGHATREIPIFDTLMPYLQECWEQAEAGEEMVLPMLRGKSNTYCRKPVLAAIAAAGVEPWEKLFSTLRASCDTDLRESFPDHVADAWIGHDKRVAKQNYLQIKEEHFRRAIDGKSNAQSNAEICSKTSQAQATKKGGSQKPRDLQRIATACDGVQKSQVGVTGIEPALR